MGIHPWSNTPPKGGGANWPKSSVASFIFSIEIAGFILKKPYRKDAQPIEVCIFQYLHPQKLKITKKANKGKGCTRNQQTYKEAVITSSLPNRKYIFLLRINSRGEEKNKTIQIRPNILQIDLECQFLYAPWSIKLQSIFPATFLIRSRHPRGSNSTKQPNCKPVIYESATTIHKEGGLHSRKNDQRTWTNQPKET